MKKIVKRVLIIAGALFALLIGIGLFYYIPMLLMTPAETGKIQNADIYTINNAGSNIYFIKTDDGYIMIDAGMNAKKTGDSLKEAGINANEVKWIFLTHSDGDHVAALTLFPNADIYMSKDELPLVNGTMKRSIFGGNKMPSGVNIEKITLLSNGQKLFLNGIKLECISAPGHTTGSMLYLIADRYLFTGDAFKIKNGKVSVHPYTMDANTGKKTIERSREKINSGYIILTAHYGLHSGE